MQITLRVLICFLGIISMNNIVAQIPIEIFIGNKKATSDLMLFKYVKKADGQMSNWLFFSRSRISVDYQMTTTNLLPQFGSTQAISYNPGSWKGFAPVAVLQVFNRGVYSKIGLQFAKVQSNFTLFTWVVSETIARPSIDYFFLGRFTPLVNKNLRMFSQLELVNTFPTQLGKNYTFIQRFRLGLKWTNLQFGLGLDLTEEGRTDFLRTQNLGGFLRYDF